jgi:hypothetical protein
VDLDELEIARWIHGGRQGESELFQPRLDPTHRASVRLFSPQRNMLSLWSVLMTLDGQTVKAHS